MSVQNNGYVCIRSETFQFVVLPARTHHYRRWRNTHTLRFRCSCSNRRLARVAQQTSTFVLQRMSHFFNTKLYQFVIRYQVLCIWTVVTFLSYHIIINKNKFVTIQFTKYSPYTSLCKSCYLQNSPAWNIMQIKMFEIFFKSTIEFFFFFF